MKKQAEKMFQLFQEGYTKKDPAFIHTFMNELFEDGHEVNVVGTGNSEVYVTKEQATELFEGDWLYWGDYSLKMESMKHQEVGQHDVYVVEGTLGYKFEHHDKRFENNHEFIKEIINNVKEDDLDHVTYAHMMSTYVLDHFLHERLEHHRMDLYPIVTVFVCKEVEGSYFIRGLTFTNPPAGLYPDERLNPYTWVNKVHEKSLEVMTQLGKELHVSSVLTLDKASDFMFVDVDGVTYQDSDAHKAFDKRMHFYDEVALKDDVGLVYEEDDVMIYSLVGTVIKKMDQKNVRLDLHQRIQKILSSTQALKDQLFVIRREIAMVNKELVLGERFEWPFRVYAVMQKVSDGYVLKMVQFGYPMDMIVEDKYL